MAENGLMLITGSNGINRDVVVKNAVFMLKLSILPGRLHIGDLLGVVLTKGGYL